MKVVLFLSFLCFHFSSFGQRLIVRGDDMGYSHSGNMALLQCSKEGIQTSIEVIVPSPWFPEAVEMLKSIPGVDVGVHLALTSEWDHIKWRPLTDCPSLRDSNGYFFPMVYPNKNYPGNSIKENNWKLSEIEKELRAQIEQAKRLIPQVSHISNHMGFVSLDKQIKDLVKRLAIEYKIDIDLDELGVQWVGYDGPKISSNDKIQSFKNMLHKLIPGKTYWFIDHPGINDPELRAIGHKGYDGVAIDRQGVTDVFTNEEIKRLIKEKGIQLIGYRDLK